MSYRRNEWCFAYFTRATRYKELGYRQDAPNLWRIIAIGGNVAVGPQYRTKAELLADLPRYARNYGCKEE